MRKLKLQYFGHLMWKADSLEKILMLGKTEGKRRRRRPRIRWLDSITDSMDMNLRKLGEIAEVRGAWCAAVRGVAKIQIWLSSWTATKVICKVVAWVILRSLFIFPKCLSYTHEVYMLIKIWWFWTCLIGSLCQEFKGKNIFSPLLHSMSQIQQQTICYTCEIYLYQTTIYCPQFNPNHHYLSKRPLQ